MSWKRSDRMLNTIREKWSDILYYLKNEYDISDDGQYKISFLREDCGEFSYDGAGPVVRCYLCSYACAFHAQLFCKAEASVYVVVARDKDRFFLSASFIYEFF